MSYSCSSLAEGLYTLKNRLIFALKDNRDFDFDDEVVDNYGHKSLY